MESLLDIKGKLSVIVGRGLLSLYEINNLKPGDIIMSSKMAEKPAYLFFNNNFLCRCEVVILDGFFGARLIDTMNDDISPVFPGVTEDIIEIVPISIRLDEINVSLKEFQNIIPGSIIGLEKVFNENEDVELLATGIPVALGKAVYINDNFGIKITKVYFKKQSEIAFRSSSYKIDPEMPDLIINDYDFRRPRKFSTENLMQIKKVHATFLQILKLLVPEVKDYHIKEMETKTFHEVFDELTTDYFFTVIENELKSGKNIVRGEKNNLIVGNQKKGFLAQENSHNYSKEWVKRLLEWFSTLNTQYMFSWDQRAIVLACKNDSILSKIDTESSMNEFILSPLQNGWKNFINLNFKFKKRSDDVKAVEIVPPNDCVLAIKIGNENKKDADFILIYPYITIEPIIHLLS